MASGDPPLPEQQHALQGGDRRSSSLSTLFCCFPSSQSASVVYGTHSQNVQQQQQQQQKQNQQQKQQHPPPPPATAILHSEPPTATATATTTTVTPVIPEDAAFDDGMEASMRSHYHNAHSGTDGDVPPPTPTPAPPITRITAKDQFDDSMYFFDAAQDSLDLEQLLELYPIVTTTTVPVKKHVSLNDPTSMLGHDSHGQVFPDATFHRNLLIQQSKRRLSWSERSNQNNHQHQQHPPAGPVLYLQPANTVPPIELETATHTTTLTATATGTATDTDTSSTYTAPPSPTFKKTPRRLSITQNMKRSVLARLSQRRFSLHNTTQQMEQLQQPRILIQERGFPGSLSPDELEACQLLVQELQKRPDLANIVYSLRHVEESPYALCRFLRATKFQVPALMERLEKQLPDFQVAQAANFYPHLQDAMTHNAPLFAFFTCYPFVTTGRAKNGCPVNYFSVGKIQAQALFSVVTFDSFQKFMWHQSYHAFSRNVQASMKENPNVVRMESITVLDLAGLTYAQASSSEAMDAIQVASRIGDNFPETLHCMIILNAPAYFSAMWSLIKQMIDPRTAKRIQVFSSAAKGTARLRELVADSQIPSDYAGTGPSLNSIMKELAQQASTGSSPTLMDDETNGATTATTDTTASMMRQRKWKRTIVETITLKRKTSKDHRIELKGGEVMTVRIFTRSATPAKVSVHGMETSVRTDVSAKALFETTLQGQAPTPPTSNNSNGITETPPSKGKDGPVAHLPTSTTVGTRMVGPGTFAMKFQDLGHNPPSGIPAGLFVVVAEVA